MNMEDALQIADPTKAAKNQLVYSVNHFHRPINTIWILCLRASVLFCWNNQLEEQWSATIVNYLAINVVKLLNFFYKESTKNHKTFGYGKYQRLVSIKCEHKVHLQKIKLMKRDATVLIFVSRMHWNSTTIERWSKQISCWVLVKPYPAASIMYRIGFRAFTSFWATMLRRTCLSKYLNVINISANIFYLTYLGRDITLF